MTVNPGEEAPVKPIDLEGQEGPLRRGAETLLEHAFAIGALGFLARKASAHDFGDGDLLFDW